VFNTAMTGYQEILTDPSYAGQLVTLTYPHIGNVGANAEDIESEVEGAVGCIVREDPTDPSNFRSEREFNDWMKGHLKIGLAGVDTRALTRRIRLRGAPNAVIAVLKHTSPTALPTCPNPLPQTTVPSAKTMTPVAPLGGASEVAGSAISGALRVTVFRRCVLSRGR
jgi:carbamoylphosphate synthase small subunit